MFSRKLYTINLLLITYTTHKLFTAECTTSLAIPPRQIQKQTERTITSATRIVLLQNRLATLQNSTSTTLQNPDFLLNFDLQPNNLADSIQNAIQSHRKLIVELQTQLDSSSSLKLPDHTPY